MPANWDLLKLRERQPVAGISWFEAAAYCLWRNGVTAATGDWGGHHRLPNEIQWEKAARGVLGRRWPWGCDWRPERVVCSEPDAARKERSNIEDNPNLSPFGIRGMAGNVWEWTTSVYPRTEPGMTLSFRSITYGIRLILRGGSFFVDRDGVRCGGRAGGIARFRDDDSGFRCVREVL